MFSPRNAAFCKLGLGSLIHIPGTKPPLSFRRGGRARPGSAATRSGVEFTRSHTHWHKIPPTRWILITLRGLCPSSLAPNVPGPSVPVSWAHISAHVHLPFYFGCLRKGRSGVEVSDCFLGLTPLRAAPLLSLCACPTEKPRVCISFISWQCERRCTITALSFKCPRLGRIHYPESDFLLCTKKQEARLPRALHCGRA